MRSLIAVALAPGLACLTTVAAVEETPETTPAPDRERGEGPYQRLILRGAGAIGREDELGSVRPGRLADVRAMVAAAKSVDSTASAQDAGSGQ